MNESATPLRRPDGQFRRAALVIYATLAINAFCIPTSVSNWVEQLDWGQMRTVLLPASNFIMRISNASGADKLYLTARDIFLSATDKNESNAR